MQAKKSDVREAVTAAIVKMLEAADGNGASFPWCRPGVAHSRPSNVLSKQRYRGINVITLWGVADALHYRSGIWGTFKHWLELGTPVRKGERGTPIVFYKPLEVADDTSDADEEPGTKTIRMAKGYWVFNADQVEGFSIPDLPTEDITTRIARADRFIEGLRIPVTHGGASAHYTPAADSITMPERCLFRDTPTSTATEGYYGVLLHECGHYADIWIMPRRLAFRPSSAHDQRSISA